MTPATTLRFLDTRVNEGLTV